MTTRNIVKLQSHSYANGEFFESTTIYLSCDEAVNFSLVDKVDKEINRLKKLSHRNKDLFMNKQIHVDWGTLAHLYRREKSFPPNWVTSSCLGIELRLTKYCTLKLIGPPIHIDSNLLKDPEYQFR